MAAIPPIRRRSALTFSVDTSRVPGPREPGCGSGWAGEGSEREWEWTWGGRRSSGALRIADDFWREWC